MEITMERPHDLTIAEAAEHSGVTAHTLRYYERAGLLPPISRDPAGHRRYNAAALGWVEFVAKLRATGMPIRDIQRYVALAREGDDTSRERMDLLEHHRERVQEQLAEASRCLQLIDEKIDHYRHRKAPA
jgi:DNA-binding transcriptional MerR regulator